MSFDSPTIFEEKHLPLVIQFARETWGRSASDAFFRWRYVDCPNQTGYLYIIENRCVAMIWNLQQTFRSNHQSLIVNEPFDWACLPSYLNSGLGVLLMKTIMDLKGAALVMGGSADTKSILPRMKWNSIGEVKPYLRPFGGRRIASVLEERAYLPSVITRPIIRVLIALCFGAANMEAPTGGHVVEGIPPDLGNYYETLTGSSPVFDERAIRWMLNAPADVGQMQILSFLIDGQVRGLSISRIYATPHGREARIVHLSASDSKDIHRWIVAETLSSLKSRDVDTVFSASAAPAFQAALKWCRFVPYGGFPIFYWPNDAGTMTPPFEIGLNTADVPFLPYGTEA